MITTITLRTPRSAGTTHFYALSTSEGVVLVDCGYDDEATWQGLDLGLQEIGLNIQDVRAVLLTHSHVDHAGLAHRLALTVGALVYVHEAEREAVVQQANLWGRSARCIAGLLREHGVPGEIVERYFQPGTGRGNETVDRDGAMDPYVRLFKDGGDLTFGDLRLRTIHCPGHSPGSTVFWHGDSQTLFSGDHLLHRTVPSPFIYFLKANCRGRTRSLPDCLASLAKVSDLPARQVLPGHGPEMDDLRGAVDRLIRHHARRSEQVLRALNGFSLSAFDLLRTLFPHVPPQRFVRGMIEVIGHLDVLVDQGRVVEENRDGLYYYRAALSEAK